MLRKAGGAKRFRALAYVSARSMMLLANSGKALQRSPSCQEFGFGVRFQAEVPAASDMTAEFANSIVLWRHPLSLSASGQLSGERSCKSAPSCFKRGFDGGKKIRGVKVHLGVEKHGIPLAIDVSPANTHDTKGIVPVLRELAGQGFRGSPLGDLGYRGKRLAKAGQKLGITVEAVARGRDGKFLPAGICWVVERSFA